MFPKAPVWFGKVIEKTTKGGVPNRTTIKKMFNAEIKELTESNFVEKSSPVNIL